MNAQFTIKGTHNGLTEVVIADLKTDLARAVLPVLLANLCMLDRKQQDYGSLNLTKFGTFGVVVRMNDKLERVVNLIKKADAVANNEPLADSFLDLANYALIAYVMQTAKWPVTTVPAGEPLRE